MTLPKRKTKGVYVDLRDRTGRRKRQCFTVDDATPKQVAALLRRAIRQVQRRKAG